MRGWFGDSRKHAQAGRKGGLATGKDKNPRNFANDLKLASRAGKRRQEIKKMLKV